MPKERLAAFSDGVIAILITIMVLELKAPHGTAFHDLRPIVPVFLTYVLSFVYVGIYWSNHHHLILASDRVNGRILWANLHLLFWLSLVPWATSWMGENDFDPVPTALYGVLLLLAAIAYYVLQTLIVREHGFDSALARALGSDWKGKLSPLIYMSAIGLAFVNRWVAMALYAGAAILWLVPDRRLEPLLRDA
ncbi:MAG: hypothetical protein JWN67_1843, partial [Actinomycetia bacterium]|nr:hypothetical protein [Actinomycetes bacterium]